MNPADGLVLLVDAIRLVAPSKTALDSKSSISLVEYVYYSQFYGVCYRFAMPMQQGIFMHPPANIYAGKTH